MHATDPLIGQSEIAGEPRANPHPRFFGIDALRGIAAMLVVFAHVGEQAADLSTGPAHVILPIIFFEYVSWGKIGVVAFFCISGFVIPFSFSHQRPAISFLVTRFFRLYPAYWLSLISACLLALTLKGSLPPISVVLANFTMVQALLRRPDLIGVYWTLFYELVFYGLCLGAFLTGWSRSPTYVLAVITGLLVLGLAVAIMRFRGEGHGLPIGLPLYLAIMHFGTLTRFKDRDAGPHARRAYTGGLILLLVLSGPIAGIGFEQHASHQRLIADIISIYLGLALFLSMKGGRVWINRVTLFLGAISYSLYLFHPLVIDAVVTLVRRNRPPYAVLIIFTSIPAIAIVISTLSERLVEKPGNRIGRALRKSYTRQQV